LVGSAWEASSVNQPELSGAGSAAPVNNQFLSHTSTQLWFPFLFFHWGIPTNLAGTQTARHASINSIDNPEQEANLEFIDSKGLWSAFFRLVAWYFTSSNSQIFWLRVSAASVIEEQFLTKGNNFLKKVSRQLSRVSVIFA